MTSALLGLGPGSCPLSAPNPAGSAAGCVLRRDRPASSNRGRQTEAIRSHEPRGPNDQPSVPDLTQLAAWRDFEENPLGFCAVVASPSPHHPLPCTAHLSCPAPAASRIACARTHNTPLVAHPAPLIVPKRATEIPRQDDLKMLFHALTRFWTGRRGTLPL